MSTQRQQLGQARVKLHKLRAKLQEAEAEIKKGLNASRDADDKTVPDHKYIEYCDIYRGLSDLLDTMSRDRDWELKPVSEFYDDASQDDEIPF